eukprot:TRINITY_DN6431_c0_g3_i1.p1 TRINITY_DN6431_c0_g3~~TRINITY_DN6431_c0_g3_i1.p1  ORF type:complete len:312 (+),score=52.16 TRINITY_DN6431_c0_g3_i1:65-937(+)
MNLREHFKLEDYPAVVNDLTVRIEKLEELVKKVDVVNEYDYFRDLFESWLWKIRRRYVEQAAMKIPSDWVTIKRADARFLVFRKGKFGVYAAPSRTILCNLSSTKKDRKRRKRGNEVESSSVEEITEVSKFCELILSGNPNYILLLFDDDDTDGTDENFQGGAWVQLKKSRMEFLTDSSVSKALGFLRSYSKFQGRKKKNAPKREATDIVDKKALQFQKTYRFIAKVFSITIPPNIQAIESSHIDAITTQVNALKPSIIWRQTIKESANTTLLNDWLIRVRQSLFFEEQN